MDASLPLDEKQRRALALLASIHERMAGVTEEEFEAALAEAELEERCEQQERLSRESRLTRTA